MKIIAQGRHPCVSCLSEADVIGGGAAAETDSSDFFISQHKNNLRVILV